MFSVNRPKLRASSITAHFNERDGQEMAAAVNHEAAVAESGSWGNRKVIDNKMQKWS
jgi:hypothetical protein